MKEWRRERIRKRTGTKSGEEDRTERKASTQHMMAGRGQIDDECGYSPEESRPPAFESSRSEKFLPDANRKDECRVLTSAHCPDVQVQAVALLSN
jgi:hypothetical protein